MARSFNGTTQYIGRSSAVVAAFPITLAWTAYLSSTTGRAIGPSLFHSILGSWVDLVAVEYVGSGIASGYGWRAIAVQQGYSTAAERKAGSDAGATGWYRVSASFPSYGTAPTLYVGGSAISGTSSAGSGGSLTLGYTYISAYTFGGSLGYGGGRAAECAVYNVEWTAEDHIAYGAGFTPPQIRPASLVAYWPLGGHHGSHDVDHWKNRYDLTAVGSPTWTDHPRVIYPRRRSFPVVATVAPPASTPHNLLLLGVGA